MTHTIENRIITAALPFANNLPHLGNIAGSHLPADVFTRFSRLKGHRVVFVGGSDEHGTATEFAALKQGTTPKDLCNKLYIEHKKVYDWFQISYDNFSRTSREIHKREVLEFFNALYSKGLIVEGQLACPFCLTCKKGLADRFIQGACPHCKYALARGDQCDDCGSPLEAHELIRPACLFCDSTQIEFKSRKHLFLDLNPLTQEIEAWLKNNKRLSKQVYSLAQGWLAQGLQPRCITRELSWGIPVPLKGYEEHVLYVWFENVIGYLSATIECLGEAGRQLWQARDTKTYYFLGKDNVPFHTLYWPGELLGINKYVLPYNVVGFQYLNYEGQKFSKSRNIGLFADKVLRSKIPADYWRFYLCYILPEKQDSEFKLSEFPERINSELIAKFGNLFQRTTALIWQKLDGKIPKVSERDLALEASIRRHLERIDNFYEQCQIRSALIETLALCSLGNKYLSEKQPWKDGNRQVLFYALEIIRLANVYISPVIPISAKRIEACLGNPGRKLDIDFTSKALGQEKFSFRKLGTEPDL